MTDNKKIVELEAGGGGKKSAELISLLRGIISDK